MTPWEGIALYSTGYLELCQLYGIAEAIEGISDRVNAREAT